MFQTTHDLTVNKLIILLLLENAKEPITQTQITDFILYKNYTDYFSLQQYLSELVNAKLINLKKQNNITIYFINQKGLDTLKLFNNRIPYSIKQEISEFTKNEKINFNILIKINADIVKDENNRYLVNCTIKENDISIINLKIKTSSENEAKKVRINWQKRARSIYKTIISDLTK